MKVSFELKKKQVVLFILTFLIAFSLTYWYLDQHSPETFAEMRAEVGEEWDVCDEFVKEDWAYWHCMEQNDIPIDYIHDREGYIQYHLTYDLVPIGIMIGILAIWLLMVLYWCIP